MKRFILASIILAVSGMDANAQNYVFGEGYPEVTPGEFTVNGKATLVISNANIDDEEEGNFDKEYTILDENFKEKKTISFSPKTYVEIIKKEVSHDGGATWEMGGYYNQREYVQPLAEIEDDLEYFNFDESKFIEDLEFTFTQTLFNNDDKWEYIVYEYEEAEVQEEIEQWQGDLVKTTNNPRKFKQTNIYSEDGKVLMSFYPSVNIDNATSYWMSIDHIWILNGKTYLYIHEHGYIIVDDDEYNLDKETLYELDRETTSVKAVSSTESKKRIAEVHDGIIKVSIDEKDTDSNLILTNSAGMLMDTQHMPKGKTNAEIDAHRLSKGVYNISLSRHGKVLNNQKFLVK